MTATLLAVVASTATSTAGLFLLAWAMGDTVSSADLSGFAGLTAAFALVLSLMLYRPILTFGRRRWAWSVSRAVFMATLILNLPVYAVLAIAAARGGLFGGRSEAILFAAGFGVGAAVFAAVSAAPAPPR